jgi:hypothetical protein
MSEFCDPMTPNVNVTANHASVAPMKQVCVFGLGSGASKLTSNSHTGAKSPVTSAQR